MEFKVHSSGGTGERSFRIEGVDLLDAVKRNFAQILSKCTFYHVPFRYPITVTPVYNKAILGGQGGVELKLEWMYSSRINQPESVHTHSISIFANENDLPDTTPFVMVGE